MYGTATGSGRDQGDLPVPAEDLHDDLEVGRTFAPLQRVQLAGNGLRIEAARCVQLGLQPLAGGLHAQSRAAVGDIAPDQCGLRMAGQRAIAAMQQVIQRIQARPELPVLAGHEHAVDLRVQASNVIDGGSFDLQGDGHVRTVALFQARMRGRVARDPRSTSGQHRLRAVWPRMVPTPGVTSVSSGVHGASVMMRSMA